MKTSFLKFKIAIYLFSLAWLVLAIILYPLHNALIIGLILVPVMAILCSVSVMVPILGQLIYVWFIYKVFLGFFFQVFPELLSIDRWFIHVITAYCVAISLIAIFVAYKNLVDYPPSEYGYFNRYNL